MINATPHSDIEERWSELLEFPGYSVSDHGRVFNSNNGNFIKASLNSRGLAIVGLMKNTLQHKRSLPLLVANAFLSRPHNETYNTPVNLNGNRMDNHYENLTWRPLWFARKYSQQFVDGHTTFDRPIEDVETGELYKNSMHASVVNGVLDSHIYLSMINNTYVWPTGQIFREALDC